MQQIEPIVVPDSAGRFAVKRGDAVISSGLTNAQAWRLCDKIKGEPLSRAEEVSDWVFRKQASEEAERHAGFRLETVERQLEQAKANAAACDADNDHKLIYSNCEQREAQRLSGVKELLSLGIQVDDYRPGIYLVAGQYLFAPLTLKWRHVNALKKNKWYRCKSARDLKERFIDRPYEAKGQKRH